MINRREMEVWSVTVADPNGFRIVFRVRARDFSELHKELRVRMFRSYDAGSLSYPIDEYNVVKAECEVR